VARRGSEPSLGRWAIQLSEGYATLCMMRTTETRGCDYMAVKFEKINADGSWKIFDQAARRLLGIDAATFVQRWDSGSYADDIDTRVMKVAMLRPSGR
jgi:hypothetical protein